jgi:hypothetical protein
MTCPFCGNPVQPDDLDTWKEVSSWVGGPKKDSSTLRKDTGRYAHGACIHKLKLGQAPDQEDIFEAREPMTRTELLKQRRAEQERERNEILPFEGE